MTLSDKIAQYLGLQRQSKTIQMPHGSQTEYDIALYWYNHQWRPTMESENIGAVRECYEKLGQTLWPVDYQEAKRQLEKRLDEILNKQVV